MKNWIIVATFFSLWLSTQFDVRIQDYLAYGLILTFGVLHGANDLAIIGKLNTEKQGYRKKLMRYLLVIAVVTVVFLVSKPMALLLFVGCSAYHFGEQHYGHNFKISSNWNPILYVSYGSVVLFMIFTLQINKVIPIINEVSGFVLQGQELVTGLFVSIGCYVLSLGILYKKGVLEVNLVKEVFMLLVLAVVFYHASLAWAFCIYFIFWHSLPSLIDQLGYLYGEISWRSFCTYLRSSILYWSLSLVGMGLLYVFLKDDLDSFISLILYLLAAITFPHVLVMRKLETSKSVP